MSWLHVLGCLVAIGLLAYLVVGLIRAEDL